MEHKIIKAKRVKIGKVDVESGQLVICDPCFIKHDKTRKQLNDYATLLKKRNRLIIDGNTRPKLFTQLDRGPHKARKTNNLGVVFDPGIGDGTYDVYAEI
jgi:hypothetical protein